MFKQNIADEVIEKIQSAGLKPKPKWQFLVKDYLIWIFFGLTVVVGSLATSIIIYMVKSNDWDLYSRLGRFFFFKTLPYFWIIILIIFIFLSYYNFKHTKSGYRYKFYVILIAAVMISLFLGSILHTAGLSKRMEMRMQQSFPLYHRLFIKGMAERRHLDFLRPGQGLIAGVIKEKSDNSLVLEDFSGKVWNILTADVASRLPMEIKTGDEIMVVGEIINENIFQAKEIRPWFNPDLTRPGPPPFPLKENILPPRINW